MLFALDARGAVTGRLRAVRRRESKTGKPIAVGPCPAGSCLYVADIGDNDASRKRITIYRVPEPSGAETSVAVKDVFHATYPDGAHDAETLLVTPAGDLFIVTKGDTGAVALYRFPQRAAPGRDPSARTRRQAARRRASRPEPNASPTAPCRPTAGGSCCGPTSALTFHRTSDLIGRQLARGAQRRPQGASAKRRARAWRSAPTARCTSRAKGAASRGPARSRVSRARSERDRGSVRGRPRTIERDEDPGRRRRARRRGRARERAARARLRRRRRRRRRRRARAGRRQRLRPRHPRRPAAGHQRPRPLPAAARATARPSRS